MTTKGNLKELSEVRTPELESLYEVKFSIKGSKFSKNIPNTSLCSSTTEKAEVNIKNSEIGNNKNINRNNNIK